MSLSKIKKSYDGLEKEYKKLAQEEAKLKKENLDLENLVNETIALYDITKNICKSLDAVKLFNFFKEHLGKYLEAEDVLFLKEDTDLASYNNYTILPLEINNKPVGYLAASNIREQDKNKFLILSHQIILGIKRALLYQRVQELAITDSLTGIFSRRHFLERLKEELERSKKLTHSFSFLMLDIDHFKEYNDNYGHLVGDAILREATKTIKENIRQVDFMGRYGGEEVSVILTETNKEQTLVVVERIRQAIEARHIKVYDEDLQVTISIGVSTFPDDASDEQLLIDNADQALYKAKESGRNRACFYSEPL